MAKHSANTPNKDTLRLEKLYKETIVPHMMKTFGYKNIMEVPKLEKITINMGVGQAAQDKKIAKAAASNITDMTGQKAQITLARKSIAGFKIRDGWPIGCKATVRRDRMYELLDRMISIAFPRIRDFRGLNPKSFDSFGNFNMGLKEQTIFPEVDYDKIDEVRGLNITITTTAKTDKEGYELLKMFKFPFRELHAQQGQ